MTTPHKFGPRTAVAVVVANMVGTGVFTSLGYQLIDLEDYFALVLLWVVGGVLALSGALTYAELGSRLPRSGGEYHFLGQLYHPGLGFVSGWVSALVGFAAPTALAAMTFAAYLDAALPELSLPRTAMAILLVGVLTIFHGRSHRSSGGLQNLFTVLKVLLIAGFCALVIVTADDPVKQTFLPGPATSAAIFSSAFAVSLIYVNYAYTGWNAATYLTGELKDPAKNLPRVLVLGTSLVLLLYVALNVVFLYSTPPELMRGKIEIGVIVARHVLGQSGGTIMGAILALLLVSTVSAMIMAGPRVLQVMGEDHRPFVWLSIKNAEDIPARAIWFQSVLTVVFIISATFESILIFSGFILGLNSLMTVTAVFRLRAAGGKPAKGEYGTWGYPITPVIYILLSAWTLAFIAFTRPIEAGVAFAILLVGGLVWYLSGRLG